MTSLNALQVLYIAMACALICAVVAVIRGDRRLSACERENREAKAKRSIQNPAADDHGAVAELNQIHWEAIVARASVWIWRLAMVLLTAAWAWWIAIPALMPTLGGD